MSIPRDYLPLTFTDSWGLLNAYQEASLFRFEEGEEIKALKAFYDASSKLSGTAWSNGYYKPTDPFPPDQGSPWTESGGQQTRFGHSPLKV
jgi:hypothetical protein